jgi:hypothetical protein
MMRPIDRAAWIVGAFVVCGAAPASAQTVSLGPSQVRVQIGGETREVDVGCPPWALVTVGSRTYVAAGACGVATLEIAGGTVSLVEQRRLSGEATAITREGDNVVATVRATNGIETRQVVATLAPAVAPLPPPADGQPLPPPPPPPSESTAPPAPSAPTYGGATDSEVPGARPDATEEEQREQRRQRIAPDRYEGVIVNADAFAFLPIDALGIGVIARALVEYHAPFPMFFRGEVLPFGIATSNQPDDPTVFLAHFQLGLDLQLFGVGIGVGGQTVNDTQFDPEPMQRDAFAVTTTIRGGAVDGLHGEIRGGLYIHSTGGDPDRFQLGFIDARVQIPISEQIALVFHGGGGSDGHAMGEGGVRIWVVGTGGPGSVGLKITAGGGYLFAIGEPRPDPSCPGCGIFTNRTELAGPGFGLGLDWRP